MPVRQEETGIGPKRVLKVLAVAMLVTGCSTPLTTREKGALAGGAIGAGTGAVIGSACGHAGTGALIGAGVGVVGGALIGDAMHAKEQPLAAPPPPPAMPPPAMPPPPEPVVVAPPPTSGVSLGINIGSALALVIVPRTHVYYAPSVPYNYFAFGGQFYLFHNEVWLSARSYNGPWTAIALERVPPPILEVPVQYYRVPPGHWKKTGPPPWAPAKGHAKKKGRDD